MIHNPQKLVHMQRRALAAESDYVRKIASSQSSSSLSFSADARKKGLFFFFFGPSLTHRPHPTANFIHLRASAAVGPESREADGCPSFLEKRDRTRAELLHRKSSQCTQISPQGHHVRAPCPNKRRKDCVCHRGGSRFYNEDADPHTILNALLVLAIW